MNKQLKHAMEQVESYRQEFATGIWRGGSLQPWHENSPENALKFWEAEVERLESASCQCGCHGNYTEHSMRAGESGRQSSVIVR